jgi:manganese transport protein
MTRAIALVPAVVVIGVYGEQKSTELLVASQVCLSMQLGFACWPLMRFTGDRAKMGEFVNAWWLQGLGWLITLTIISLNLKLLWSALVPESMVRVLSGWLGSV